MNNKQHCYTMILCFIHLSNFGNEKMLVPHFNAKEFSKLANNKSMRIVIESRNNTYTSPTFGKLEEHDGDDSSEKTQELTDEEINEFNKNHPVKNTFKKPLPNNNNVQKKSNAHISKKNNVKGKKNTKKKQHNQSKKSNLSYVDTNFELKSFTVIEPKEIDILIRQKEESYRQKTMQLEVLRQGIQTLKEHIDEQRVLIAIYTKIHTESKSSLLEEELAPRKFLKGYAMQVITYKEIEIEQKILLDNEDKLDDDITLAEKKSIELDQIKKNILLLQKFKNLQEINNKLSTESKNIIEKEEEVQRKIKNQNEEINKIHRKKLRQKMEELKIKKN